MHIWQSEFSDSKMLDGLCILCSLVKIVEKNIIFKTLNMLLVTGFLSEQSL